MGAGASIGLGQPSFYCYECRVSFTVSQAMAEEEEAPNCPNCGASGFVERRELPPWALEGLTPDNLSQAVMRSGNSALDQRRIESAARLFSLLNLATMVTENAMSAANNLEAAIDRSMRDRQPVTNPTPDEVLDILPLFVMDKKDVEQNPECPICNDINEVGDTLSQMPCLHMYHTDCIMPWLRQHNSCPMCRSELKLDNGSVSKCLELRRENRKREGLIPLDSLSDRELRRRLTLRCVEVSEVEEGMTDHLLKLLMECPSQSAFYEPPRAERERKREEEREKERELDREARAEERALEQRAAEQRVAERSIAEQRLAAMRASSETTASSVSSTSASAVYSADVDQRGAVVGSSLNSLINRTSRTGNAGMASARPMIGRMVEARDALSDSHSSHDNDSGSSAPTSPMMSLSTRAALAGVGAGRAALRVGLGVGPPADRGLEDGEVVSSGSTALRFAPDGLPSISPYTSSDEEDSDDEVGGGSMGAAALAQAEAARALRARALNDRVGGGGGGSVLSAASRARVAAVTRPRSQSLVAGNSTAASAAAAAAAAVASTSSSGYGSVLRSTPSTRRSRGGGTPSSAAQTAMALLSSGSNTYASGRPRRRSTPGALTSATFSYNSGSTGSPSANNSSAVVLTRRSAARAAATSIAGGGAGSGSNGGVTFTARSSRAANGSSSYSISRVGASIGGSTD